MNKSVIIGAIVIVLAAGGYYQFSYKPAQEAAEAEAAAKAAAEATPAPTAAPTTAATTEPTTEPTTAPTTEATVAPTTEPTAAPTTEPTTAPTTAPTVEPTTATPSPEAALDPANFDADAVIAVIDGSSLDAATKATLKTAVEAAKANPALVADTVAQVKAALGM